MIEGIKKYFGITELGSTIPRELIGGVVTFFSMVYILAVQPGIMAAAGMDPGHVFTATAISAGVATLVMAFLGRLPIALASGLGINAFIAFSVCGAMGFTWQTAIAAVFVEGLLFIILSVTNVREKIINGIPDTLKKAVALGIGLFIAVIGLVDAGILVAGGATPLAINSISSGAPLVAIIGLVIMIVLYSLKVPGSIFIAIIAATIIGIPLGVTQGIPNIIGKPAAPYLPWDIVAGLTGIKIFDFIAVFVSLLFVDMFDTISTFAGIAEQGNLKDEHGKIRNVKNGLLSDAIGTVFGSLIGSTTVTSYIESSTGVAVGARTGLASVVTGLLFLLALVFSPLFLAIPSAAIAPCLIFVGFLMLGAVTGLDFKDIEVGLPVFITMLMVPMSYSISEGLAWGFISYTLVKICKGKYKEISITTWILTAIFLVKILFIHV
jgi:AGZA family xanthine/uracil permease-like MFS transporter